MSDSMARQLEAILKRSDIVSVVTQLKAVLEGLPPDNSSANDLHLRDLLEAFITGWELGSPLGQQGRICGEENVGTLNDTQEHTVRTIGD